MNYCFYCSLWIFRFPKTNYPQINETILSLTTWPRNSRWYKCEKCTYRNSEQFEPAFIFKGRQFLSKVTFSSPPLLFNPVRGKLKAGAMRKPNPSASFTALWRFLLDSIDHVARKIKTVLRLRTPFSSQSAEHGNRRRHFVHCAQETVEC